jgi:hypothetical protein
MPPHLVGQIDGSFHRSNRFLNSVFDRIHGFLHGVLDRGHRVRDGAGGTFHRFLDFVFQRLQLVMQGGTGILDPVADFLRIFLR